MCSYTGRVLTKLSSGGVAPPFAWLALASSPGYTLQSSSLVQFACACAK